MANALFDKAREGFLAGEIDWDTAVIKVALVRSYTFSASHKFVSDATGAGGASIVVTSGALTSKTITDGIADAADVVFASVAAGAAIPYILIFQASAVGGGADVASSAQRLICFLDTGTGLPVTPGGADITVAWSNTAGTLIFKL